MGHPGGFVGRRLRAVAFPGLGAMLLLVVTALAPASARAQQRIGYIDSQFILQNIPDYATVQQRLDRSAQEWQTELEQMQKSVDDLFRDYQARELLYTQEERKRKQEEIVEREREVENFRMRYFGPEGELFRQQEALVRPIQERIIVAVQEVAEEGGYDYVFDKSGDFLFLYAREQFDLSRAVLQELGIDTEKLTGTR